MKPASLRDRAHLAEGAQDFRLARKLYRRLAMVHLLADNYPLARMYAQAFHDCHRKTKGNR